MTSDLTNPNKSGFRAKGSFQVATTGGSSGFLAKSQKTQIKNQEKIAIAFLFDATSSREDSWASAQKIQTEMIAEYAKSGANVEVGIIVHRGKVQTVGWFQDAQEAARTMADVTCKFGCTKIEKGLEEALKSPSNLKPKAVVMVGDCCEEEHGDIGRAALYLKRQGIPVHAFHEGSNTNGEHVYKMVSSLTGGVFAKFGSNMSLRDLIKPLFVHTVHGKEAFQDMVNRGDQGAKILADNGLLRLGPK